MKLTKAEASEYIRCAKDPVYAFLNYAYLKDVSGGAVQWGPIAYDWQIELIEKLHAGENIIALKSRQVGFSWTVGFYIAWLVHFKRDIETLVLSVNQEKAMKLLSKIKFICVHFPDFIRREFNTDSKTRLSVIHEREGGKVVSESSIDSLTTTGSSGRGDTAYFIFIDELAHMQDGTAVYTAVKPATSRGGQMVIGSSPNGPENQYAMLWMHADSGDSTTFIPIRIHYTDCGFDEEWLEIVSDGMTDEDVLQEYELSFIGTGSPAFDPQHLKDCYIPLHDIVSGDDYPELREFVEKSRRFATGVDTAVIRAGRGRRRRDYNAIVSMNEYGIQVASETNKMLLDEWAGKTVDYGDRKLEIPGYVSAWHVKFPGIMFIEDNGPGLTVENRHELPEDGFSDSIAKTTSAKRKQRLVDQFRLAIAGQQVVITDKKTFYQLTLYQDLGGGKYSAPAGSNDDLVIAILEAYDALIFMGGYEFTMPAIKRATGAYEVFSDAGQVPISAPLIPSPGLDSAFDLNLPTITISEEEWSQFLPTGAGIERISEII